MSELKPCPFCGSENVSQSRGQKGDGSPWFYIECEDCAAVADSAEAWNRRPTIWRYPEEHGMPEKWQLVLFVFRWWTGSQYGDEKFDTCIYDPKQHDWDAGDYVIDRYLPLPSDHRGEL